MRNTYQNSYNFFKQKAYTQEKNHASLILAAYELKTPENMGAIIRLAANLNAEKVLFIHREFDINKSKIEKVAHSSQNKVDYQIISETLFTETIKDKSLIAIETTSNSCNIFKASLPKQAVLLCGSERFGLPNHLIEKCHQSVFIPLPGVTRSMNVSHAMSIAAFEWAKQHIPALLMD